MTEGRKKAQEAINRMSPGNKSIFINWEAIQNLPYEFDVIVTDIVFDLNRLEKDFTNVGSKSNPSWYPKTELIYEIANARGVMGLDEKTIEVVRQEVDVNDMYMKGIDDPPNYRLMDVAVRVTKKSYVLETDGTRRPSSPCTNEFNYWIRALTQWLKEQEEFKDYTLKEIQRKGYSFKPKYDTVAKRRMSYFELQKFAVSQAETKAFAKTVRELAQLPTGFTNEDLKSGKLTFYKIVRSQEVVKLETAARITCIKNGGNPENMQLENNLFGTNHQIEAPKSQIESTNIVNVEQQSEIEKEPEQFVDDYNVPDFPQEPEPVQVEETQPTKRIANKPFMFMTDDERRLYIVSVLEEYIKPKSKNRIAIEAFGNNALGFTMKILNNYEKEKLRVLAKTVFSIEGIPGVEKLKHKIVMEYLEEEKKDAKPYKE